MLERNKLNSQSSRELLIEAWLTFISAGLTDQAEELLRMINRKNLRRAWQAEQSEVSETQWKPEDRNLI